MNIYKAPNLIISPKRKVYLPTPASRNSHSVDARWRVTMHSLIQAHLSGTHCQSMFNKQTPPTCSNQRSNRIFRLRIFRITQFVFHSLPLSLFLPLSLSFSLSVPPLSLPLSLSVLSFSLCSLHVFSLSLALM